jgi:hypothetical protein
MTIWTTAWQKGGLGATGGPLSVGNSPQPISVSKTVIDINKLMNGTNNVAAITLASGDSVVVQTIPANTIVLGLQVIVTITDAESSTVSVGDSGSATRYVNAASTLTAGTVLTQALTTNPLHYYAAADTLRIQFNGTYTTSSTGAYRFTIWTLDATADPISTTQS